MCDYLRGRLFECDTYRSRVRPTSLGSPAARHISARYQRTSRRHKQTGRPSNAERHFLLGTQHCNGTLASHVTTHCQVASHVTTHHRVASHVTTHHRVASHRNYRPPSGFSRDYTPPSGFSRNYTPPSGFSP